MKIYKQDLNGTSNRKTKFDATDVLKLNSVIIKMVGNVRAVNTILATDHYNQIYLESPYNVHQVNL